jgi:5-methylcytosine-specific restriction endonuclease McrA
MKIISRAEAEAGGIESYFTGLPCKNGHVAERKTADGRCRACAVARARKWAVGHREMVRAYERACYRTRTPEQKAKDATRNRVRAARWRAKYPEKQTAATLNWRAANRERVKETARRGTSTHRARKVNAPGRYRASDVEQIRKAQRDRCAYCRCSLHDKGHVDHIIPLAKGGSNWPSNLQLTCQPCNNRKHVKAPEVYARERGLLL